MRKAPASASYAHFLDDPDQLAHRPDRFVERGLFVAVERDLDNALDPAGANHNRDADVEVLDPVLTVEPRRAGQHAFLVAEIRLRHLNRRAGGSIKGRDRKST